MTLRSRVVVLLASACCCLAGAGAAFADSVDELGQKLRSDPDYKVRLSAALNLGKLGDRRGVAALTEALRDPDRSVRGVAAAALGKLVDRSLAGEVAERAMAALAAAASGDGDDLVRREAQRSLDAARAARARVYVEVGPMADTTRKAPAIPALMRRQVVSSLSKAAPAYLTRWPSGRPPTAGDLKKNGTAGYYIDGSLVALDISRAPTRVTCSISLMVATYPQKSLFGFMKGGAEVDAGSSEAAIAEATSDCVGAVLDDLVATRLLPTIEARSP